MEVEFGVAVSVTVEPAATSALQVGSKPVQVTPAPVTVPPPVPFTVDVSVYAGTKLAVTVFAWSIVTVHAPVPLHAPDQLPNTDEPATPVGVSVTLVPSRYVAEHAVPQLMPAGCEVMVPDPPLTTVESA